MNFLINESAQKTEPKSKVVKYLKETNSEIIVNFFGNGREGDVITELGSLRSRESLNFGRSPEFETHFFTINIGATRSELHL